MQIILTGFLVGAAVHYGAEAGCAEPAPTRGEIELSWAAELDGLAQTDDQVSSALSTAAGCPRVRVTAVVQAARTVQLVQRVEHEETSPAPSRYGEVSFYNASLRWFNRVERTAVVVEGLVSGPWGARTIS